MENGKLRPYEPLLMSFMRAGDALIGPGYFLVLSWVYQMYNPSYLGVATLMVFMNLVCFHSLGLYRSWRSVSRRYEIHQIVLGCIAVYVLLLIAGYSLKVSHIFSRRVVLTWMVTWPLLMGVERLIIRAVVRKYRERGLNVRRAVIAGAWELGGRLAHWTDENLWSGTKIIGFFDDEQKKPVGAYPILGTLRDLPAFVRNHNVDMIYLALPMRDETKIERLLDELADSMASVYLIPDIFLFDLLLQGNLMYFDNIPVIALRDTPLLGFNALFKRIEDLVLAGLALLLCSPIMLAVTLAMKLTSDGPVFFTQWRYGIDGRPIKIYKFRTMSVCEDGYNFVQAIKCDPRVTRLGALLRRTSLDELPQLINVIQGRMSIVGPRPHPVAMNEAYRKIVPGYMLRHKVRPGITGLAQINGWRGETDTLEKMEKRIEYDLEYLRQWSLILDLKIIFQTLWNGSSRTNAY